MQGYKPESKLKTLITSDLDSFKAIVRKMDVASAVDLHNPNRKQISLLRKEDAEDLEDSLILALTYFAGIMQAKDPALDFIIPEIAQEIIAQYWFLTFEEVCLVLKNGAIGKYKHPQQFTKQSFDIETVLGWVKHYNDYERMAYVAAENTKIQNLSIETEKTEEKVLEMYENGKVYFEIMEKIEEERKAKEAEKAKKTADYQRFKADYFKNKPQESEAQDAN